MNCHRKLSVALVLFAAIFLAAGCGGSSDNKQESNPPASPGAPEDLPQQISVNLSGTSVVPTGVTTTATGSATIQYDPTSGAITGSVSLNGIDVTGVQIRDGDAGDKGTPVTLLFPAAAGDGSWNVERGLVLSADQLRRFLAGGYHLIVYSNPFPDGELRAQLLPTNWIATKAEPNATEVVLPPETPPIASAGSAVTGLTVNTVTGEIRGQATVTGIAATKVHLHLGKPGESGPMILAMELDRTDFSTWRFPAGSSLRADYIEALQRGDTYISVLSVPYPAGELRAQLTLQQ